MGAVYRKELKSYFNTLSAYVFIAFVLLGGGAAFATVNLGNETTGLSAFFDSLQYVLFIAAPILTARLALGGDRAMLSAPVRTGAIIAGKYLAALTVLAISLAASLVYPLILECLGEPSWSEAASGFLGLLLLGALLIAAGQFVSSFFAKKAAAGWLALCFMLLVLLAQAVIIGMKGPVGGALVKATPSYHMNAFISGIVGLSDAVYFLSLSALLLFFSVRVTAYRMRFR